MGRLSTFSASLKTKWFESFEVFLATDRNNLTSLGIDYIQQKRSPGLKVMDLGCVNIQLFEKLLHAFKALSATV